MTEPSPLLALANVACVRGARLLFKGLDLALHSGEALVVGGPNGTGKSSLLRMVAGLLTPYAGNIERPETVALADESLALDERLPLRRALAFWTTLDASSPDAAMEAMGIAALAPVPVRILSTGQRKRATLARVIASGASLWLLDEPANGLDSEGLALLGKAVASHRARGGAVLAASHQPLPIQGARTLALISA